MSSIVFVFLFQMNDFVRDKFSEKDGSIPLPAEILAGGCVSIRTWGCADIQCAQLYVTPQRLVTGAWKYQRGGAGPDPTPCLQFKPTRCGSSGNNTLIKDKTRQVVSTPWSFGLTPPRKVELDQVRLHPLDVFVLHRDVGGCSGSWDSSDQDGCLVRVKILDRIWKQLIFKGGANEACFREEIFIQDKIYWKCLRSNVAGGRCSNYYPFTSHRSFHISLIQTFVLFIISACCTACAWSISKSHDHKYIQAVYMPRIQ